MAGQQGTGKQGHKDSAEPYPHSKSASGQSDQHKKRQDLAQQKSASGADKGASEDLKSREYKGEDGDIHHHTKTSMDQQKKH